MSIAATVQNGAIKLPEGVHLPDGTRVEIVLTQEEPDPVKALGWMAEYAGCIDGLPKDFAAEHDHYIHGTPKRAGR